MNSHFSWILVALSYFTFLHIVAYIFIYDILVFLSKNEPGCFWKGGKKYGKLLIEAIIFPFCLNSHGEKFYFCVWNLSLWNFLSHISGVQMARKWHNMQWQKIRSDRANRYERNNLTAVDLIEFDAFSFNSWKFDCFLPIRFGCCVCVQ